MPEYLLYVSTVSFHSDHPIGKAIALRETLLDRLAKERDLQAVTSVTLAAHFLALPEHSRLR